MFGNCCTPITMIIITARIDRPKTLTLCIEEYFEIQDYDVVITYVKRLFLRTYIVEKKSVELRLAAVDKKSS